ncbi:MAG: CoA transferase [Gammaproteobacteria bacterium]|nr:CoA transferase [Gammaproteobacteria bacterium]
MQPFEGIRVIDMTHVYAGPFSTYQLAVLGADVIKVEPPRAPDMTRIEGVSAVSNEAGLGTSFAAQNAGKRALALDLKTTAGVEILKRLVAGADVLVENYRGGTLDKLDLGYGVLAQINPRLIYCSITGFGCTGPKGRDPAYDAVVQAYSGAMAANGELGAAPVRIGPPVIDYGTGAQAALAISAALLQRHKTGKGQRIDVSMLDAALLSMSALVTDTLVSGHSPSGQGNADPSYPGYAAYDTRDGVLMVGAYTNAQMADLYRALGDDERAAAVAAEPRHLMAARRGGDRAFLQACFARNTADHWEALLNRAGVPAARVRTLGEALHDEQLRGRNALQPNPSARIPGLPARLPVAAYTYAHGGPALCSGPPSVGEHSRAILEQLGYDEPAIESLIEQGVVGAKEVN